MKLTLLKIMVLISSPLWMVSLASAQTEAANLEEALLAYPENSKVVFFDESINENKTFVMIETAGSNSAFQFKQCQVSSSPESDLFKCRNIGEVITMEEILLIQEKIQQIKQDNKELQAHNDSLDEYNSSLTRISKVTKYLGGAIGMVGGFYGSAVVTSLATANITPSGFLYIAAATTVVGAGLGYTGGYWGGKGVEVLLEKDDFAMISTNYTDLEHSVIQPVLKEIHKSSITNQVIGAPVVDINKLSRDLNTLMMDKIYILGPDAA